MSECRLRSATRRSSMVRFIDYFFINDPQGPRSYVTDTSRSGCERVRPTLLWPQQLVRREQKKIPHHSTYVVKSWPLRHPPGNRSA